VLDVLEYKETSQINPDDELKALMQLWVAKLEKEGCSIVML